MIGTNNPLPNELQDPIKDYQSVNTLNHKTDDDVEVEKLKNQVKALEAKNSKLTALQTTTKHKEDPLVDAEWNKTMNRRAYMDDMWAIRERS
jgi:hypothetical protein